MHHERQSAPGVEVRQRECEVADIGVLEVGDAAGAHERLEAHNPSIQQFLPCTSASGTGCEAACSWQHTPSAATRCLRSLGPSHPRMQRPQRACPMWIGRAGELHWLAAAPPQRGRTFAAASFRRKVSLVVVVGKLFSGMSTTVVTPPAAAARVPVRKPSQSALWRERRVREATETRVTRASAPAGLVQVDVHIHQSLPSTASSQRLRIECLEVAYRADDSVCVVQRPLRRSFGRGDCSYKTVSHMHDGRQCAARGDDASGKQRIGAGVQPVQAARRVRAPPRGVHHPVQEHREGDHRERLLDASHQGR